MNSQELKQQLHRRAEVLGVRELKMIRAESLKDSPGLYDNLMKILPQAKSLISFLLPFPKGCLHLLRDPQRTMPFYVRLAGLGARRLDEISIDLSMRLEEQGFLATPVFICTPLEMPKSYDLWGYLSQIDVAARSGLGWIGKNGLLVSPKFGPRVGLGTVVTDAVFEEDRPLNEKCPDDCSVCVEKCPADALDGTGKVNRINCTMKQAIAPLTVMMMKEFSLKEHLDMIINLGAVDEHTWYRCNACVVQCPVGV
jgi:epoxyqueuosine reductase QueG